MAVVRTEWAQGPDGVAMATSVSEYEGLVVAVGGTYLGDGDTSYWAMVWNGEAGQFDKVYTGYYQGGDIDAPEDLINDYQALVSAEEALARAKSAIAVRAALEAQVAYEATLPLKSRTVRVVKGRKVPVGTTGEVKVNCEGQWGRRVLLVTQDGTEHWTAADNVEVVAAATEEVAA